MRVAARTALVHVLLGFWLAVTVGTWVVATGSFRQAAGLTMARRGEPDGHARWRADVTRPRDVARYQAAEVNRWLFRAAGRGRVVLGGLVLVLVAWPRPLRRSALGACSLAALLAAVQLLVIVPWAEAAGRALAFAPLPRPPELAAAARTMGAVHALQGVVDLATVGLLVYAAWAVTARRAEADAPVDVG